MPEVNNLKPKVQKNKNHMDQIKYNVAKNYEHHYYYDSSKVLTWKKSNEVPLKHGFEEGVNVSMLIVTHA